MPFFQEQNDLYIEPSVLLEFAGSLDLPGEIEFSIFTTAVFIELDGAEDDAGEISPIPSGAGSFIALPDPSGTIDEFIVTTKKVYLSLNGVIDAPGQIEQILPILPLVNPTPIINTIAASDFKQTLKARLFINGVETDFRSARWSKPNDNLGSILNIVLAKTSLNTIPLNAAFKFQIGEMTPLGWEWKTILDSGKLDSRNITRSWGNRAPNDSLSFSTLSPTEDKFAVAPRKNIICYDASRTNVDISEIETINAINGNNVPTEKRGYGVLTLYNLLHIAFVEIGGFSVIETDLPNYPILRGTFSYQQSAKESIAPFIGIFRPHFIPLPGNKLRILNGMKSIDPSLLTAIKITEDDYENLSLQSRDFLADGFTVQYQANSMYGSPTDRLEQKPEPHGRFGQPNFTETQINQIWRDWKDADGRLLDSKLVSETRTTYKGATAVAEIIEDHLYDGQGLETEVRKSRRAWLQTLPDGEWGLERVKQSVKENSYQTDPFNPNRQYLAQSVTHTAGLYTVDEDNPQLGEPVKRDYELVADSANLSENMRLEEGDLQTVVEKFVPVGNGQVRYYQSGTNHLTDAPLEDFDEIRSGDISLNAAVSKQLELVIWKDGINPNRGRPPVPFNIGELPLFFGIPLAVYELENPHKLEGSINIPGFNKNLDRGQYFKGEGRNDEDLGDYITEGFDVEIEILERGHKFTTILQVSEV